MVRKLLMICTKAKAVQQKSYLNQPFDFYSSVDYVKLTISPIV